VRTVGVGGRSTRRACSKPALSSGTRSAASGRRLFQEYRCTWRRPAPGAGGPEGSILVCEPSGSPRRRLHERLKSRYEASRHHLHGRRQSRRRPRSPTATARKKCPTKAIDLPSTRRARPPRLLHGKGSRGRRGRDQRVVEKDGADSRTGKSSSRTKISCRDLEATSAPQCRQKTAIQEIAERHQSSRARDARPPANRVVLLPAPPASGRRSSQAASPRRSASSSSAST